MRVRVCVLSLWVGSQISLMKSCYCQSPFKPSHIWSPELFDFEHRKSTNTDTIYFPHSKSTVQTLCSVYYGSDKVLHTVGFLLWNTGLFLSLQATFRWSNLKRKHHSLLGTRRHNKHNNDVNSGGQVMDFPEWSMLNCIFLQLPLLAWKVLFLLYCNHL